VITLRSGAASSAGSVRSLNEDDYVATAPVFVVADGMGGHRSGEVASGIAVREFQRLLERDRLAPTDVIEAFDRANDRILWRTEQEPDRAGMGTTLTCLVVVDTGGVDHWMLVNVGDSRVYRFAAGALRQLSVDHSEVEELVAAGAITRDEARVHPRRNVITRSLGTVRPPVPDEWLLPPSRGERFLLCSDGLVDELRDEEIGAVLARHPGPQAAADALVDAAVRAGGHDNVTVVVVDVVETQGTALDDDDTVPREPVTAP
jgi:serine/threonine protein phosphatase PrpC